MIRVREAKAKLVEGRKVVGNKEYRYKYFTLPLNLYLPKGMVERWGTDFIVEIDESKGIITIRPKKAAEGKRER